MEELEAGVKGGQTWIVCPHCKRGSGINVPEHYVKKTLGCKCGGKFLVTFIRRKCDRKKISVTGKITINNEEHPIILVDLSLQGVSFTVYSAKVGIKRTYDISFSSHGSTVKTPIKIVGVSDKYVKAEFVFIDEYCGAKLSVRRIWDRLL